MTRRARHGAVTMMACGLMLLAAVASPPVASGQATEEYERVIAEALAEFEAGHWVEALALFNRANEIYPNARVLRGVGMASFELRDYVSAAQALQQALDSTERPLTPEQRSAVQELLDRSLRFVGRLRLQVHPAPDTVLVDGRPGVLEEGVVLLNPGAHEVTLSAAGFRSEVRMVESTGGAETLVVVTLTPDSGEQTEPSPASVDLTAPSTPVEERAHDPLWTVGWATAGVGAAAGVAAVLTGVFAQRMHDDLEADCGGPCPSDRQADIDRGTRLARTSTGLTFASVAALGAGVAFIVLGRGDGDEPEVQVSTDVGPGHAAARLQVRF